MNVAILGIEQDSQYVVNVIENLYNPWLETINKMPLNVVAYAMGGVNVNPPVREIGGKAVLNFEEFADLYHKKLIHKIIIPRESYCGITPYVIHLKSLGIKADDVCLTQRLSAVFYKTRHLNTEFNLRDFIELYPYAKYLPYLEFRIADHCNLNCKACAEFSSLVKKPHFPNLKKFTRDFERLHEFINDIGMIYILGGEPLLNPEINEYVRLSRRLYPQSLINVVTNGFLLLNMPGEFFETLRECNASISISYYFPLEKKTEQIKRFLDAKEVNYSLSGKTPREDFFVNTCLEPRDTPKLFTCEYSGCRNLWEGKLTNCYKSSAIKIFNEYFNQNLPEDSGLIDLYDPTLTTEKLQAKLLEPFELCKYCTTDQWRKWGRVTYPASINDWLAD